MGLPFYTAAACDFIALVTSSIAYMRLNKLEAAEAHAGKATYSPRAHTGPKVHHVRMSNVYREENRLERRRHASGSMRCRRGRRAARCATD